jgi:hypothetical protein
VTNETTERIERFLNRFRQACTRRAEAEASYEGLEHQRKIVLAEAMKQAERDGHSAVSAQEREARVSEDYRYIIQCIINARLELELARAEVDRLKLAASLSQTAKANERAEIRAYQSS